MLLVVTLYGLTACGGIGGGGPSNDGSQQIGDPGVGGSKAAPGLGGGGEAGSPTADWTDDTIKVLNCVGSTGSNNPDYNSDSDQDDQKNNKAVYHVKGKMGLAFAGEFHPCIGSCKNQTVRAVDRKSNQFYETKVDGNGGFSVDIVTEVKANVDFYWLKDVKYSPTHPAEWQSCDDTIQCVETPPWLELKPSKNDSSCDTEKWG